MTGGGATGCRGIGCCATGCCMTGGGATGSCMNGGWVTGGGATGSWMTGCGATGGGAKGGCVTDRGATGSCATGSCATGPFCTGDGSLVSGSGPARISAGGFVVCPDGAVDAATSAGGGPSATIAFRQSQVRMVWSSASKRSSTDGPSMNDAGASPFAFGGSALVTACVPFVATSVFPNRSLTGHAHPGRGRGPVSQHRRSRA